MPFLVYEHKAKICLNIPTVITEAPKKCTNGKNRCNSWGIRTLLKVPGQVQTAREKIENFGDEYLRNSAN